MKKIIATFIILISAFTVSAQISKGKILAGGDLGYSSVSENTSPNQVYKYNAGTFNLSIGKAIKKNSVFGISLGFTTYYAKNYPAGIDTSTDRENDYTMGLFYRKYVSLGKRFYFFGELKAAYEAGKGKSTYSFGVSPSSVEDFTKNGGEIGIETGLSYQIFKRVQVDLSLPNIAGIAYSQRKTTQENQVTPVTTNKTFSAYSSFSGAALGNLAIGFRLVL